MIEVVRRLDRYHGFGPYPGSQRLAAPRAGQPSPPPPLALPEPPAALPAPEAEEAAEGRKANLAASHCYYTFLFMHNSILRFKK